MGNTVKAKLTADTTSYLSKEDQDEYDLAFGNRVDSSAIDTTGYIEPEITPPDTSGTGYGEFLGDIYSDVKEQDWLLPTLTGTGVGVAGYKAAPKLFGSLASPGRFGGGQIKIKYELSELAYDAGLSLAETGGFNEPRQRAIGGAAAGAAFLGAGAAINKGIDVLNNTLWADYSSRIADGRFHGKVEAVRKRMEDGIRSKVAPAVRAEAKAMGKRQPHLTKGMVSDEIKRRTNEQVAEKMKKYDRRLKTKLKKGLSAPAARKWDSLVKKLVKNPSTAFKLGKYLAGTGRVPMLAAKLVASTSAVAFPEVVSSLIGLGGYIWLAADIIKIIEDYPKMGAEIDRIIRGPKSTEDKISESMAQ